eukprot:4017781-Prymnesium_polylepis.2
MSTSLSPPHWTWIDDSSRLKNEKLSLGVGGGQYAMSRGVEARRRHRARRAPSQSSARIPNLRRSLPFKKGLDVGRPADAQVRVEAEVLDERCGRVQRANVPGDENALKREPYQHHTDAEEDVGAFAHCARAAVGHLQRIAVVLVAEGAEGRTCFVPCVTPHLHKLCCVLYAGAVERVATSSTTAGTLEEC